MIAGIWAEVLELDSAAVGMDDPFLDLGGNSILAARILARLNQALGIAPPFELLVANGTPAALAAAIQREWMSAIPEAELAAILDALDVVSDQEVEVLLSGASGEWPI